MSQEARNLLDGDEEMNAKEQLEETGVQAQVRP